MEEKERIETPATNETVTNETVANETATNETVASDTATNDNITKEVQSTTEVAIDESDISIACKDEAKAREYIAKKLKDEEEQAIARQKKVENNKRIGGILKKLVAIVGFSAALIAVVFVWFTGQTVTCIGEVRNIEAEVFSLFTPKSIGDYIAILSESEITQILTSKGFFVTDEMVKAYATVSVTESIIAIAMIVAVVGFFALAVFDLVSNIKNKFENNRMLGALGTVVSYVCGAVMLKSIEYGEISVVFKERSRVIAFFDLKFGFNALTIVGIVLVVVLMTSVFAGKAISGLLTEEKQSSTGIILDKNRAIAPIAERVITAAVAVFAVIAIFLAGASAITTTSKGAAAVYYKNEVTGNYEIKNYNEETGSKMTISSLLKKYANEAEELEYKISVCDSKLAENPLDIDTEIEKDEYKNSLAETRNLMQNALNFGMTTIYVNIALILFSGVFLCFILCGKRIHNGDFSIVIAAMQGFGALVGLILMIFVNVSFARLQVNVVNLAPYFHFIMVVASVIGTFYIRKFIGLNKLEK